MASERLRQHDVVLEGQTMSGARIKLRPMTEEDWVLLNRWNSDPEVLYFSEGDDVSSYRPDEVKDIYRTTSQTAFCFIIEVDGMPVGECWLQKMNMKRVLEQYPGQDCRRIDLMIGEKSYWNQGIGSETIRLLTAFGFLQEGVDVIYILEISDYNLRSRRAFQKAGYRFVKEVPQPPGMKATIGYDLALTRKQFLAGGDKGC